MEEPWIYSGYGQTGGGYYSQPVVSGGEGSGGHEKLSGAGDIGGAAGDAGVSAPTGAAGAGWSEPARVATVAPVARPAAAEAKGADASLASVIDTIEAIIIALIIALTFRAFIVEAFVIPTGSMAPTLLGAHFKVICPECGYEFDHNAALQVQLTRDRTEVKSLTKPAELTDNTLIPCDEPGPNPRVFCPNCGFPIAPQRLPQYLGTVRAMDDRASKVRDVSLAWANNGDRILVLKFLYSILAPSRWDVIVFKEPQDAKDNFIKRLIGLPGETIEIVNGDIYTGTGGETDPAKLNIARKPEHLQGHLWQVVYDNDFYPIDEGVSPPPPQPGDFRRAEPWENPWQPPQGWVSGGPWAKGVAMRYTGTGASSLTFQMHKPYGANTLGYNAEMMDWDLSATVVPVGDFRVQTTWKPLQDGESAAITVGRPGNRFMARWDSTGLELLKFDPMTGAWASVEKATSGLPAIKAGQAHEIAVNNVDRAVYVYMDGSLVLTHETRWTAADAIADEQAYPPNLDRPDGVIRIDVSGPGELSHLKVFRDLYYTQSDPRTMFVKMWTANEGHPLVLGENEFFALGDNSRQSMDGRMWPTVFSALDDLGTRPGIVPRRYLLGKAFFVYWPAGYRPTTNNAVPVFSNLPLVPNTGEMRLIR